MIRNPGCAAVMLCLSAAVLAGAKRPITGADLYSFHWAADPRISPNGTQVVYTYVSVNPKHDGYDTSLWIVPTSGGDGRPLTNGPHDAGARWSPDGRRIAFVRASEKDGRPQPGQIYLLPMDGGEARQLTDLPKGAGNPVWSPDGRNIAFSSTTLAKEIEKKDKPEEISDVRVINRAAYRANGGGYLDTDRPAHIWTVPARPAACLRKNPYS